MNNLLLSIRRNRKYSWCVAIIIALAYRSAYVMAKSLIWANRKLMFSIKTDDPNMQIKLFFQVIGFNFMIETSSLILPALIFGGLLLYCLREKAVGYSSAALIVFLAPNSRFWYFWQAASTGIQFSRFMTPLLGAGVLLLVVWLLNAVTLRLGAGVNSTKPETVME